MTGVLPSIFLIFFKEWLVQQYWLCLSPITFYLGERSVCLPTWKVREIVMEHLRSSKQARLSSKALSYISLGYFSYRAIFSPSRSTPIQSWSYMRLDNLQLPHTTSNFLYGHSGQGGYGNQSGHDGQVGHGQDIQERQNWHLNLNFQVTCLGQHSQFLRSF